MVIMAKAILISSSDDEGVVCVLPAKVKSRPTPKADEADKQSKDNILFHFILVFSRRKKVKL